MGLLTEIFSLGSMNFYNIFNTSRQAGHMKYTNLLRTSLKSLAKTNRNIPNSSFYRIEVKKMFFDVKPSPLIIKLQNCYCK